MRMLPRPRKLTPVEQAEATLRAKYATPLLDALTPIPEVNREELLAQILKPTYPSPLEGPAEPPPNRTFRPLNDETESTTEGKKQ